MRIGIDISGLAWKYRTGVQSLFYGLIEGLAGLELGREDVQVVLVDHSAQDAGDRLTGLDARWEMRSTPFPRFPPRLVEPTSPRAVARGIHAWNTAVQILRHSAANRRGALDRVLGDIDVFQVWNWDIRRAPRARHVITVPDVIPLVFPEWYDADFIAGVRSSLEFAKQDARRIIAISEFTKAEMVRVAGIAADKIDVVYPGVRPMFQPARDPACIQQVLERYGIPNCGYLLSVGYLDPRKNVQGHVRAFERLATRPAFKDVHLVLAGPDSINTAALLKEVQGSGLGERVHMTGFVPDEDLPPLMSGARAFLFCSLYEGFGFPVLEAMSCGVPVITSNSTSLIEISGDAAVLVDPNDPELIADGIERLITDEGLRHDSIARGLEQARKFTFENYAREHLRIYRESCD